MRKPNWRASRRGNGKKRSHRDQGDHAIESRRSIWVFVPRIECLEDRVLLSSSSTVAPSSPYLPPQRVLSNPQGFLSEAARGAPLDIAYGYLRAHASELQLSASSIDGAIVTSQYTDVDNLDYARFRTRFGTQVVF